MRKVDISILTCLALLGLIFYGCDHKLISEEDLVNQTGKIEQFSSIFIIIPEDAQIPKLHAENLPNELHKNGLKILFSGRFEPTDPASLYYALPFKLIRIERVN